MVRSIVLIFIVLSCNNIEEQKFEKSRWNEMDDIFYANRESMVNDLMDNHLKRGMHYSELKNLIGPHNNYANIRKSTIAYEIMVDYGWNIDPVKGKTLYFQINKDSIIEDYYLESWSR